MNILNHAENRIWKRIITGFLIFCIMVGCVGCGYAEAAPGQGETASSESNQDITSLNMEPVFDYELPTVASNIRIDRIGYGSQAKKLAYFLAKELPKEFTVVDQTTGEAVYHGEIKDASIQAADGSMVGIGDFTACEKEGIYYLEAEVIGRSYPFRIGTLPYEDLLTEEMRHFYLRRCGLSLPLEYADDMAHNACHTSLVAMRFNDKITRDVSGGWHTDESGARSVEDGCRAMLRLLGAYEYGGGVFGDDGRIPESGNEIPDLMDELRYEVDWLLKMQDEKSGGVYRAVSVVSSKDAEGTGVLEDISEEATLAFAAAVARFSYLYQSFDNAYATTCIQAADRAMRYLRYQGADPQSDAYFLASAEMYRATGYQNYRNYVLTYFSVNLEPDLQNETVLDGCITYLETRQKTDVQICGRIIKMIRSMAEQYSYQLSEILCGSKETDQKQLYTQIKILLIVNYLISSNEYENVIEQYLHYYLGCNASQTIEMLLPEEVRASETGELVQNAIDRPDENAGRILLLAGVIRNQSTEGP